MIRLLFPNIEELKQLHYEAVKSYVADIMRKEQRKDFYQKVIDLPGFESYDKEYDFRHDTFDWPNNLCWPIARLLPVGWLIALSF